jgi:hypothetical protein
MLFFTTGVRRALRSGEANESTYSTAAFAGGILVAVSIAISAVVTFTATAAAHKHNLEVSTVMGFLDDSTWVPWVAGSAVLFLSTGLGGLRTAALPKWLSIVTIVLGVLCLLGPTGVAVFFVTPLWLIVTGVVLARRQSTTIALPAETATPSYA